MSIFSKVAGTWQTMSKIYTNRAGVWKTVQNVYSKNSGVWQQVYANIKTWVQMGQTFSGIGGSVAVNSNGTRMIVGDSYDAETVSIYDFNGTTWAQVGQTLSGTTGDNFGQSVSINASGDQILIGAPTAGEGYVKAYSLSGATWVQLGQTLSITSAGNSQFGSSVSFNATGTRMVIGARADNLTLGTTWVYALSGSTWNQLGQTIMGTSAYSGWSVSINATGDRIAVGAPGSLGGKVFVYQLTASTWVLMGSSIPAEGTLHYFGNSVSLTSTGDRVVGGAPEGNLNGARSGYFKAYDWNGTSWGQAGTTISGAASDLMGSSVSISSDGTRLGIGAPHTIYGAGFAKVYIYSNQTGSLDWNPLSPTLTGDNNQNLGTSVSMSSAGEQITVGGSPGSTSFVKNFWNN